MLRAGAVRLNCALNLIIFIYSCVSLPAAHAKMAQVPPPEIDVNNILENGMGFQCTRSDGTIFRSPLASCSFWWPACLKRVPRNQRRFPAACADPQFSIVYYPVEGSAPYLQSHLYNNDPGSGTTAELPIQFHHKTDGTPFSEVSASTSPPSSGSAFFPGQEKGSLPASASGSLPGGNENIPAWYKTAMAKTPPVLSIKNGDLAQPARAYEKTASKNSPSKYEATLSAIYGNASPGRNIVETSDANSASDKSAARIAGDLASSDLNNPAPTNPEAGSSKKNYNDPWLDYENTASREALVEKLSKSPKLRSQLKEKISRALRETEAENTRGPPPERLEFYQQVLTEAETRARRGSFDSLSPLEPRSVFSMNGDDTEQEIRRLIASMDSEHGDESIHYSLFPRVHRALWRQVGAGNLNLRHSKQLRGGELLSR